MKIITETLSNNEYDNGNCDYAFIDITPDMAIEYLGYINEINELRNIPSIYNLQTFDYSVTYFSFYEELGGLIDEFEKTNKLKLFEDVVICPDDYEIPTEAIQRTECNILNIMKDTIKWNAFVKHTNIEVETKHISIDILKQIANI